MQKYKKCLKTVLAVGTHKLAELAFHAAAFVIFLHTAEHAPDKKCPDAETYGIQQ